MLYFFNGKCLRLSKPPQLVTVDQHMFAKAISMATIFLEVSAFGLSFLSARELHSPGLFFFAVCFMHYYLR